MCLLCFFFCCESFILLSGVHLPTRFIVWRSLAHLFFCLAFTCPLVLLSDVHLPTCFIVWCSLAHLFYCLASIAHPFYCLPFTCPLVLLSDLHLLTHFIVCCEHAHLVFLKTNSQILMNMISLCCRCAAVFKYLFYQCSTIFN